MPASAFSLEHLLFPISLETFFSEYWEQKPLLISRNDPSYYDGLVSLDQIDGLISRYAQDQTISLSVVSLEKGAVRVREHGVNAYFNHAQIYGAFSGGSTLRIRHMERHLDAGQYLAAEIEKHTSAPVHINMYLTPRNSRGFGRHQDGHDVFIIQTAGRKHWKVYEIPEALPHDEVIRGRPSLFGNADYDYEPDRGKNGREPQLLIDVTLRPGDLLYMPRGWYHNAYTSDALSMHFTVGAFVLTWHDALVHALSSLFTENATLRRALPPGFASGKTDAEQLHHLSESVAQAVRDQLTAEKINEAVEALAMQFTSSRQGSFSRYFSDLDRLDKISVDDELAIRSGLTYRFDLEDEKVNLVYRDRNVRLPIDTKPILCYMAEVDSFTAAELPTDLSTENKLRVVGHLLEHGFLTFVNSIVEEEVHSDSV